MMPHRHAWRCDASEFISRLLGPCRLVLPPGTMDLSWCLQTDFVGRAQQVLSLPSSGCGMPACLYTPGACEHMSSLIAEAFSRMASRLQLSCIPLKLTTLIPAATGKHKHNSPMLKQSLASLPLIAYRVQIPCQTTFPHGNVIQKLRPCVLLAVTVLMAWTMMLRQQSCLCGQAVALDSKGQHCISCQIINRPEGLVKMLGACLNTSAGNLV